MNGALTLFGLLYTRNIMQDLGAEGAILMPTVSYARVLFCFMIPLTLYQQLMVYVRFDGAPILSLVSTIVCAVMNLVLDVLFVGPLGWGASGAALATCLAYTVAMLINAFHLLQKDNNLVLRRGSLSAGRIFRLLKTGVPLSVTQLGMAVVTFLFNIRIMQVDGSMYLDVYGAITQLSVVAMALYEGTAQACQPILAACFGAGDRGRMYRTIRYGFVIEAVLMVLAAAMYLLGAPLVLDAFIRSLASYKVIGAVPYSLLCTETEFSEIDMTARAILLLAGTDPRFTVFHPMNNHTVSFADIVYAMRGYGFDIETLEDEEFAKRKAQAGDTSGALIAYDSREGAERRYERAELRIHGSRTAPTGLQVAGIRRKIHREHAQGSGRTRHVRRITKHILRKRF